MPLQEDLQKYGMSIFRKTDDKGNFDGQYSLRESGGFGQVGGQRDIPGFNPQTYGLTPESFGTFNPYVDRGHATSKANTAFEGIYNTYKTNEANALALGGPVTPPPRAPQPDLNAMLASGNHTNVGTAQAPQLVPKGTPDPKTATYEQSLAGPAGQIPGVAPVDPNAISKRYEESFNNAKATGYQVPSTYEGAVDMFKTFLPGQQQADQTGNFISQDPYLQSTIQAFQQYMSQQNQRTSLVQEYQNLLNSSGIQGIDTELINMKKVIEGTEDDIRTEVTKAGGFATDSQVIALSNARNKQLIKNYNTLLETRNSKEKYLDTMMNLTQQDRKAADDRFETMMNFGFKIAEVNQKMKQSAIETLERSAGVLGWDGIYQATQGNPQLVRQIENMYGLPAGSLAIAARRDREARALEVREREANITNKEDSVSWSAPYVDTTTGNQVQRNLKTGEIRTLNNPSDSSNRGDLKSQMDSILQQRNAFGADGKVSWETYLAMYQDWLNNGGTAQSFDANYPIGTYMDAGNQASYKKALGKGETEESLY